MFGFIDVVLFCFLSAVIDCGEPKSLLNGGVHQVSGQDNQYQSVIQYYCNEPFYAFLGGVNGEMIIFLFFILKVCVQSIGISCKH